MIWMIAVAGLFLLLFAAILVMEHKRVDQMMEQIKSHQTTSKTVADYLQPFMIDYSCKERNGKNID
jgi:hypothetical protein